MTSTASAPTYTLQQNMTTDAVHALRWDGGTITGISDVFSQASEDQMTADMLPSVEYHPYQGDPAGLDAEGHVMWLPPTMEATQTIGPTGDPLAGLLTTYDGKVYRQRLVSGNGHMVFTLLPVGGEAPNLIITGPDTMTVGELARQASEYLNGASAAQE